MAPPIDSSAALAADSPDSLKNHSRIAAIGYGLLCIYYTAIVLITLAKVPWASFDQIASELSGQSDSILALAIFAIANSVLAVWAWNIFSINRWAFWCAVLAGMIAALCFLGIFVFSVVAWRSPEAGSVGWWTMSVSTVQLLIYGFCAMLLLRVGIVTRRQRKEARMLAMGPLPTTTL
jgi:hypothetical protein